MAAEPIFYAGVNPMRIAIIGSGPSGFYAAEAVQKKVPGVAIDMFERLHAPYGLVRYGVAPDHEKLKSVTKVFDMVAGKPGLRWFGQVELGRDIQLEDLTRRYHAVVLATGAQASRRLGIPGDDKPGSYNAADFVAWYNGHPDFRHLQFDLSGETAIVVGHGNVALDVARILLKPVDELASTEIASHALEALRNSKVRKVCVVGRRGPAQAKFTNKELAEFEQLAGVTALVRDDEMAFNEASRLELESPAGDEARRNVALLRKFADVAADAVSPNERCIEFRFCLAPVRLEGNEQVAALVLERTALTGSAFQQGSRGTGEFLLMPCHAVFASVGYKGVAPANVPFDARAATVRHVNGRIVDETGVQQPGLYCTGWIKRGPTGVIGTNRNDSVETVATLLADLQAGALGEPAAGDDIADLLRNRGVDFLDFQAWSRLDAFEKQTGARSGKAREKLVQRHEVRAALQAAAGSSLTCTT
ncbi:ferredoxin--NADP+ reductase [Variovorax sp. OV700]|jgi:ferredoxin--NADP+ reductase|nr:ferredoxin--NADP+ reductase [Variovorax sp. OV700]